MPNRRVGRVGSSSAALPIGPSPARGTTARGRGSSEADEPIHVVSIAVKPARLVIDVSIPDARNRYMTPERATLVLERFPALREHACVNGRGRTFGSVIESTSTAHLLEHLAIQIQTRSSHDESATFVGTTEWLDEDVGLAQIQLSFKDDLEALRALREAVACIAWLLERPE